MATLTNGKVSCTARCTLARAALSAPAGMRTASSVPAPSAFVAVPSTVLSPKLAAEAKSAASSAAAAASIAPAPLAAASSFASRASCDSDRPKNCRSCSSRPALDSSSSPPAPCPATPVSADVDVDVDVDDSGSAAGVGGEGTGGGTGGRGRSKPDASTSRPETSISFTFHEQKQTAGARPCRYTAVHATKQRLVVTLVYTTAAVSPPISVLRESDGWPAPSLRWVVMPPRFSCGHVVDSTAGSLTFGARKRL